MATTLLIHSGHLSLDNGAVFPLTRYFELAKAVGVPADTGQYYGDDRITVDDADLPIVEELLVEQCMLYKVEGRDKDWQNVRTDHVAKRLSYSPHLN